MSYSSMSPYPPEYDYGDEPGPPTHLREREPWIRPGGGPSRCRCAPRWQNRFVRPWEVDREARYRGGAAFLGSVSRTCVIGQKPINLTVIGGRDKSGRETWRALVFDTHDLAASGTPHLSAKPVAKKDFATVGAAKFWAMRRFARMCKGGR